MSTKDKSDSEDMEKFFWGAEEEIQLFSALKKLKPVGINKYFFMACISDRLSSALNRDISSDQIWTHLKSLYNLTALDALEPLPFPNDECEFSLPETEFSAFISKKKIEIENETIKTEVKAEVVAQKISKFFDFLIKMFLFYFVIHRVCLKYYSIYRIDDVIC